VKVSEFLENFRYVAEAPNGVTKLRELVLSLAMRGELVPQNANDTSAQQVIRQMEQERRAAHRNVRRRPPKQQSDLRATDIPYPIPETWQWVAFGSIARHNAGKTLDKGRNSGRPRKYITTSNLYWGRFDLNDVREMLIRDDELDRCTARRGDLLICEGGEAGRAAVWDSDEEICFQNHIHRARLLGGIDPYYAFRYLQKLDATQEINKYRKGVGISNLSGKALSSIPFPLAPVAEQKRIVAKVDALMALCDKLDAQKQKLETRYFSLSNAREAQFSEASTHQNLLQLSVPPVSGDSIRNALLLAAFKGLISQRLPEDQSVAEMLANAASEQENLLAASKRRRPQWQRKLARARAIFALPSSWTWVRVADVVERVTVGFVGSMVQHYRTEGIPFLRSQNVRRNRFDATGMVFISKEFHDSIAKSALAPNDVVVTRSGSVGVSCVIPKAVKEANCSDLVVIKNPIAVVPEFLCYYLNSVASTHIAAGKVGIALTHFNTKSVAELSLPLPPYNEQVRIVETIDAVLNTIAYFENQQLRRRKLGTQLAQAFVAAITGTTSEDAKPMKAPKTELITRLEVEARDARPGTDQPLAILLAEADGPLSAKALWQRSGLPIETFYQQLKTEKAAGWIIEPEPARVREIKED